MLLFYRHGVKPRAIVGTTRYTVRRTELIIIRLLTANLYLLRELNLHCIIRPTFKRCEEMFNLFQGQKDLLFHQMATIQPGFCFLQLGICYY